jgi:hypothetical protein
MSPRSITHDAVIVDHSALIALGTGNQVMSRLVVAAHDEPDLYLYAPAMCVAAAVAHRPQLGDHVGSLLAIQVMDLGFTDAQAAGVLIAEGADWRSAHAIAAAKPSAEWPSGLPVVTAVPDAYISQGLRIIELT